MAFPRDEHLGVDLILPDFGYLRDAEVRAVVLTHAHEDHVGALPYLMREVRVREVWATRLTLGLVKSKLDEHGLLRAAELREIDPDGAADRARAVPARVRAHGALGARHGRHRDRDPGRPRLPHRRLEARPHARRRAAHRRRQARGAREPRRRPALRRLDERRAARVHPLRARRRRGVPPDHPGASGRVLVSSFASNIHRMQQAIDVAVDCGRRVASSAARCAGT